MAILVNPYSRSELWRTEFERLLPDEELRWYPDMGDPGDIEFVVAWLMKRSELAACTNLQAILSLGAGAEQWQKPGMPDVPVVRLADPAMANEMAAYCVSYVVRQQRRFVDAETHSRNGEWQIPEGAQTWSHTIGILGYGTIGSRIGQAFVDLGYPVNAWARSRREVPGIRAFAGQDELEAFLGSSDVVINVLPSTEGTQGLLDASRFAQFRPGAMFVNVGRGSVVADEQELVDALDTGNLSSAVLDVTRPEPPAAESPLWSHPAVTLTPHLSGITQIRSAAEVVTANIRRIRNGEEAWPVLDRERGY